MMIETLWDRHYVAGVTGNYHGDMAHAFAKMLDDSDCDPDTRRKMQTAIDIHCRLEAAASYTGRQWFTEKFREIPTYTRSFV